MRFLDSGGRAIGDLMLNTLTILEDSNSAFFSDGRTVVTLTNAEMTTYGIFLPAVRLAIADCVYGTGGGGGGGGASTLMNAEYAIDGTDVTNENAVIVTPGLIPDGDEVVLSFRGILLNTEDFNTFTHSTGVLDWAAPTGMADLVPAVDDVIQVWWLA